MFATLPDVLRLLVVLIFAWAAVRDVRTRRLPNRLWPPIYAFGALLLIWETFHLWPLAGIEGRLFLVQVAVSLLFVAPLGYAFWYLGAFGGADAKALIAIAIVFPTFPTYAIGSTLLPLVVTDVGVFSLTILTNTVLIALAYPIGLAVYNLSRGEMSPVIALARPVTTPSIAHRHGRLFETADGMTRNGLDLDALRMYLRWRGLTLPELRSDPDQFRDPTSLSETFDPTDGGTHVGPTVGAGAADSRAGGAGDAGSRAGDAGAAGSRAGGAGAAGSRAGDTGDAGDAGGAGGAYNGLNGSSSEIDSEADTNSEKTTTSTTDDPWAAERFLSAIDGTAYGTDPETLREGLTVVSRSDRVWVSPGLPFVVPMFLGMIVAVTYGDLLFSILRVGGLVP